MNYIGILITYIFVSNLVLTQALGAGTAAALRPTRIKTAAAGFVAVMAVLAGILGWSARNFILLPLEADYLSILVFALLVTGISSALHAALRAYMPKLYEDVKPFAPHVLTDGVVMGLLLVLMAEGYGFGQVFFASLGAGLGFMLVSFLFGNIHERILLHPTRKAFSGLPILFVSLGLMALAFTAFDSSLLKNLNFM